MAAIAAIAVGVVVLGGVALATPSSGVATVTTARFPVAERVHVNNKGFLLNTSGLADVVEQTIVAQPGWSSGWHSHPGPTIVSVKSGAITIYHGDCMGVRYAAGQAFVEGNPHPVVARNEGAVAVELQVTFVIPRDVNARTDEPNPGCSVN